GPAISRCAFPFKMPRCAARRCLDLVTSKEDEGAAGTPPLEYKMPANIGRRAVTFGLAAGALATLPTAACAQPRRGGLIERRESQYNTIYVVEQEDGQIAMIFGANQTLYTESLYDPARPRTLPVAYTRYMTIALAYTPQVRSVLEIGLGGGRTAYYLRLLMPNTQITCVELDPAVIELAQRHFGIRTDNNFRIVQRDGRIYLNQNQTRHDVIMVDAYRGTFVPFHLTTREFYMICKRRLNPGGVMVQNVEPSSMLYDAALATIKSVFGNVDTYEAEGNVVVVGYDGPQKSITDLTARATALQTQNRFTHALPAMLARRRPITAVNGRILTDDFAPVEYLRAIERHNEKR
ncbi:MAG: fused MFS/spermidine synthase, partial [Caulobacterales bacterium]